MYLYVPLGQLACCPGTDQHYKTSSESAVIIHVESYIYIYRTRSMVHVSILTMLPPNFLCGSPASEIEMEEIGKPRDLEILPAGKLCLCVIYY